MINEREQPHLMRDDGLYGVGGCSVASAGKRTVDSMKYEN
jgi:hypothetical protein